MAITPRRMEWAMTTAIGAETYLPAVPSNLTALRGDVRMTANAIHSAEKGDSHAVDQIGWRAVDPGGLHGVAMKSLRVLIIEDDLTIGPLLAETIEELGHVVCALEVDAAAAVSAARRCRPDLMIVDIGLGEASGISAVEQILKAGFVPHVFVTGDGLRGLPVGPEAILIQKPYRCSDLVAAIAKAIDGKAKRDESDSAQAGGVK
jgi:two-component system, response regulator PdtaR